ncbi:hypothetical protein [Shewanella marina]|uniref:hypothetical protein n=1 Tax=Shewanella marina TaxID=487319 RepID=UPI00046F3D22|nr:hypothetical protein [Shewanella marina]
MLSPMLLPIMPIIGAVTANINELIRDEAKQYNPSLKVSIATYSFAIAAFVLVWFALLTAGIYITSETNVATGVEFMLLFLGGLMVYTFAKLGRFIGNGLQLWIYRLSLPLVLVGCYVITKLA